MSSLFQAARAASAGKVQEAPRLGFRVLVVEDDAMTREVLRMMLRSAGCSSVMALDGIDALEKYDAGSFDLIITDIGMPRMDGFDMIRRLREERGCRLPIIVLTSYTELEDEMRAYAEGATIYLLKPMARSDMFLALMWAKDAEEDRRA